jgi:hypothetical protein
MIAAVAVVVAAVVSVAKVEAAPAAVTLQLNATFADKFKPVPCPAGTDPTVGCYSNSGNSVVKGLGGATASYLTS